jgi:3-keto-disaccharide hydrolase
VIGPIARRLALAGWLASVVGSGAVVAQQAAGIPGVSPQQMRALAGMTATISPLVDAATAARDRLIEATFAAPRNEAAIRAAADALGSAERRLADARADAFAVVQASTDRLGPGQTAALVSMGGSFLRSAAGRGGNPPLSETQRAALVRMATDLVPLTDAVTKARSDVVAASLAMPRDRAAIAAGVDALMRAERALADGRATAIAAMQASAGALAAHQVAALVALGGTIRTTGLPFTEPDPADFSDHEGYTALFDGVSLKGWDGNPAIWRVENGAIVGESTVERPSGNSYLAYRGVEARDFTLKLEIKTEGSGGTGIQYRSRTGLPWLAPVPSSVGAPNLAWMMTGPQADFWPMSPVYTGQFYSENTPMRVLAWRGQVVEGFGGARKRLLGTIADRYALGAAVRPDDWNQYTIVARGGTFMHIINGQLMAVMIDDDPASSNNQPGEIGIEIEQVTRVSVRNIWLKKLT